MSIFILSPNPSSELMELGESKLIGVIDNDGVCFQKIHPVFDDRRADEAIRLPGTKGEKRIFYLLGFHLSVKNEGVEFPSNDPAELFCGSNEGGNSIMKENYLPSSVQLRKHGISKHRFVPLEYQSVYRFFARRRGRKEAELFEAGERKIERPRDWGCGQA